MSCLNRHIFMCLGLLLVPNIACALAANDVRFGLHDNICRFVLEVDDDTPYQLTMSGEQIEISLPKIEWHKLIQIGKRKTLGCFSDYTYGQKIQDKSYFILYFNKPVAIHKSFFLPKKSDSNARLVIDFKASTPTSTPTPKITYINIPKRISNIIDKPFDIIPISKPIIDNPKKWTVVIDPGHGGQDPGTIGVMGSNEKDIALNMGLILKKILDQDERFETHMTRDTDKYIRLRERLAYCRHSNGDIVISLHADSTKKPAMRGASIYLLSEHASDVEAEALAAKENKEDIIEGIDLSEHSGDIHNILIDLAQRDSLNLAVEFANRLVKETSKISKMLSNSVRYADLAVLKAPDIPSVLIELGCISNQEDEKLLISGSYPPKFAQAIKKALVEFFVWKDKANEV
jgi:N-acetylmuramoyl-L-alanine amidase